ncbi:MULTISPECIES: hypothetical protein [Bacillaceae]|uniref:Uncharacterized protein n=1 Tax=Evansella alkalicola TaxID=745819 RepID=A0ABS6JQN4_9BACI|nr:MULTISPECIES: hypothetical protein [Bacillaceae]MBU9720863.1 hypothetical protein [Bacillus alkalicola]
MEKLDKQSQKNLTEAYHVLGNVVMVCALSFIVLFYSMESIPSWSYGIVVSLSGIIVINLCRKITLKQMYGINFLLILICFLI